MTVTHVDGVAVPRQDLRWLVCAIGGDVFIVCDAHLLWAENRCDGGFTAAPLVPRVVGPRPCVACVDGESEERWPTDRAGRPYCGQDFMAGTICTLPPGHAGFHAPICQDCHGDWYDGTCTCHDDEDEDE